MAKPEPRYLPFAQRLKRARAAQLARTGKEATPAQMAKAIKRSLATISQWFAGNQIGSVEQIEAMARVVETEPGWLAFGPDDVEPPIAVRGKPSGRHRYMERISEPDADPRERPGKQRA